MHHVIRVAMLAMLIGALLGCSATLASAEAPARPYSITEERVPCAAFEPLRQPFFGDTHVHTTLSQDASTQDTRVRPRDAYRFAKGEPLGLQPYDADGNSWIETSSRVLENTRSRLAP